MKEVKIDGGICTKSCDQRVRIPPSLRTRSIDRVVNGGSEAETTSNKVSMEKADGVLMETLRARTKSAGIDHPRLIVMGSDPYGFT